MSSPSSTSDVQRRASRQTSPPHTRPEADRPPLDVGGDRPGPSRGMASRGRALPARMAGRVREDQSDKCWVGRSAPATTVRVRLCADGTSRSAEHHPPSGPIHANVVRPGTVRIAPAGPPGRFDPHRVRTRSRPRAPDAPATPVWLGVGSRRVDRKSPLASARVAHFGHCSRSRLHRARESVRVQG